MSARLGAALVVVAATVLACTDRSPGSAPPVATQSPPTEESFSVPLFAGDTVPRLLQLADTSSVLMEDDLGGDAGGRWLALDRSNPATLRRVDIIVGRVPHPCIADDSVRLGRTLSIAGGGDALALLRGNPGLRAGPIVTGTLDSAYAAPESPAGGEVVLVADLNRDEGPDLLLQATPKYSLRVLRLLLFQPGAERRYREVATSQQAAC